MFCSCAWTQKADVSLFLRPESADASRCLSDTTFDVRVGALSKVAMLASDKKFTYLGSYMLVTIIIQPLPTDLKPCISSLARVLLIDLFKQQIS